MRSGFRTGLEKNGTEAAGGGEGEEGKGGGYPSASTCSYIKTVFIAKNAHGMVESAKCEKA